MRSALFFPLYAVCTAQGIILPTDIWGPWNLEQIL